MIKLKIVKYTTRCCTVYKKLCRSRFKFLLKSAVVNRVLKARISLSLRSKSIFCAYRYGISFHLVFSDKHMFTEQISGPENG